MKKIINDKRLMIKACDLYYNENKTQQQIADILNISYPTVSHLLAGAKSSDILNITICDLDMVKYWEMEQQIKERFGLKDVIIVESCDMNRKLGVAASKYLDSIISTGDMVGISMGSTLYNVSHSIVKKNVDNVTFVPLVGGMGRLRTELHSNNLAEILSKKYNGSYIPLYAPARVSSKAVRKQIESEQSVAEVLSMEKNIDIALEGIGYPNEKSSIMATGYYKENEIQSLLKRGVAGEICMQFYDVLGSTSAYKSDNTVIGLNISNLRKIPFSIGVAGGIDKVPAIMGAIAGRYINVLITDYFSAEKIIETG